MSEESHGALQCGVRVFKNKISINTEHEYGFIVRIYFFSSGINNIFQKENLQISGKGFFNHSWIHF